MRYILLLLPLLLFSCYIPPEDEEAQSEQKEVKSLKSSNTVKQPKQSDDSGLQFSAPASETFLKMLSSEYKARGEELMQDGFTNEAKDFFKKSELAKLRDARYYSEKTFKLSASRENEVELARLFFERLRSNVSIFEFFPESLARMQTYYDCMIVEFKHEAQGHNKRDFCVNRFDKMQKGFQRTGFTKNIKYEKEAKRDSFAIYFALGSAVIENKYKDLIYKEVKSIKSNKFKINVTGLADKTGSKGINYKISKERAEAVKNLIVRYGIDSSRVSIEYLADNFSLINTEEAERFNRRVIVDVVLYE